MRFRNIVVLMLTIMMTLSFVPAKAESKQYQVRFTLDSIFERVSSTECESETYMELSVNGRSITIWSNLTDKDYSTILDCGRWVSVNEWIDLPLAADQVLDISIIFYEKDGDYHQAATYFTTLYPDQWSRGYWSQAGNSKRKCYDSNDPWGDYCDQDYRVYYAIQAWR